MESYERLKSFKSTAVTTFTIRVHFNSSPLSPPGGWTLLQTNHTAWSINGSASFLAEKGLGSPAFFSWYVDVDDKNSSAYILNVQQSGLSLPGAASYMGDASNTVRGEGLWFS